MSETTENAMERQRRLYRTLAWVGIVAGIVVTVAVIFFAGFAVGRTAGYPGWHRYPGGPGACPMMQQGGMMGPGMMGPGMMEPEMTGPGMTGPSSSPQRPS